LIYLLRHPVLICIAAAVVGAIISPWLTPAPMPYAGADIEISLIETQKNSGRKRWDNSRKFSELASNYVNRVKSLDTFFTQASRHPSLPQIEARTLTAIGWAEWNASKSSASMHYFGKATELFNDPSAHLGMAKVHSTNQNPEAALLHLAAVASSNIGNNPGPALLEASKIKSEQDQPFDACLFAIRARLASPANISIYLQLATCLSEMKMLPAAIEVLTMPRVLNDPKAMLLRAELTAKEGRYFDALKILDENFSSRTLSDYSTADIQLLKTQGSIESSRNNHKSAQRWFEAALSLAPHDRDIRLNVAWSINKQRKFSEATRHFETVLESDATNPSALLGLGEAYFELGKFTESENFLALLIQNPPGTLVARKHFVGWAHFWQGRLFELRAEVDRALTEFNEALRFNPTNIPARVHLANLLEKHRSCEEAIPHRIEIKQIQTGRGFHDTIINQCEAKQ
jgi:tetratricopeptide (TPR) repeat protein